MAVKALSFASNPTAKLTREAARHAERRRPLAEACRATPTRATITSRAARSSALPTMLLTASVWMGCTAKIAAVAKAPAVELRNTPARARTPTLTRACNATFTTW